MPTIPELNFKKPVDVNLKVKTYSNCDDVQLCWRTLDSSNKDYPIEGCIGFMIERQRKTNGKWSKIETLRNRVGFEHITIDPTNPNEISEPSSKWPFQQYNWTDHGANNNDAVRYRISALANTEDFTLGKDDLSVILQSEWTEQINVNAEVDKDFSVFFNRGTVMSQYVARIARQKQWSAKDIKDNITNLKEPLRLFLSGELRVAMINLLDNAIKDPFLDVYAILFELGDDELIGKLKQIGSRAHVILSDGPNKTNSTPVKYVDANKESRELLRSAGVDVTDRMLAKEGLGHNKILITVSNKTNTPLSAFTGSTNWSSTGLCTQLNNGILLKNPKTVKVFYEYWQVLKSAGDIFTPELTAFNGAAPKMVNDTDIWFTRTKKTSKGVTPPDINYIKELVKQAKSSILYVMFQPGKEPLADIIQKRNDENMYIRGVVSTVIPSNKEQFEIMDEQDGKSYQTDLLQPDGVQKDFEWWIKEVTRKEFIPTSGGKIGYAITHAKMIVIDAFGDNPIVITGSHNFSISASQSNDENFVVIRNNKKLAQHYAVACISMYNHYKWRGYLYSKALKNEEPWSHLKKEPTWQHNFLKSERFIKHLNVWC